ncbi:hypothetical protein SAMN05720606_102150 [Paenibacillus polysaccharolyticus]|uniref:Uncharacterized protein n=1 Tax=Paenibacillus polysaccharolyticus TaxID=582692 RepID=A0A1G5CNZ6_9BACL|nr:hypothetical protein [Paenibacillus polysaccharolyticus]SCY03970.1 hypothetical protein SAMN05720606_102150 [Paenibacillus polysaccharolyticus]
MSDSKNYIKDYSKEAYLNEVSFTEWRTANLMCYSPHYHWIWNGLRERAPTESG